MTNFNKKGFALLPVLLVILALVVVGGGVYAYYNAQQIVAPQTVVNQQSTTTSLAAVSSSATIENVLTQNASTVTLAGTAIGLNAVEVAISVPGMYGEGNAYGKVVSVVNGKWSAAFENIPTGTYMEDVWVVPPTGLAPKVRLAEKTLVINTSSQSSISVPGMSQYTDKDFGFSFWYPSSWKVSSCRPNNLGDQVCDDNILYVRGSTTTITIGEYASTSKSVSASTSNDYYFFDTTAHTWMLMHNGQTTPADVSQNTMGGLHMLTFVEDIYGALSGHSINIPLSAEKFVIVSTDNLCTKNSCMEINGVPLGKTITAADPAVATLVSAAQQTATIQAEQKAYAGQ
jgi:hypothetical protein